MKKSDLKEIIREAIMEMALTEKTPPNFPKKLHDKLLKQYSGDKSKAYATMWKIFYAKEDGNQKINEMWTAFEGEDHDETDLSNPEEKKEVQIGRELQGLVSQLLSMHGVTDEKEEEGGEEPAPDAGNEEPQQDSEPIAEAEGDEPAAGEEADTDNPAENEEVEIAKKIKALANELLAMHGITDDADSNEPSK